MVCRQLAALMARSAAPRSTCTNFSASANVPADTSGPTAGPAPKAGGAPAGGSLGCCPTSALRNPTAAPSNPIEAAAKKSLRDSDISPPRNGRVLYRVWRQDGPCHVSKPATPRNAIQAPMVDVYRLSVGRLRIALRGVKSVGQLGMLGKHFHHALSSEILAPLAALLLHLHADLGKGGDRFLTERCLVKLDQAAYLLMREILIVDGDRQIQQMLDVGL